MISVQVDARSGARGCSWHHVQESQPALSQAALGRNPENVADQANSGRIKIRNAQEPSRSIGGTSLTERIR